jgi:hypothetical protein
MTSFHPLRLGLAVVSVVTAVVAALLLMPAPNAQAFYIQNHEAITRAALPQIPNDVMTQILIGPPPGAGAVGTDAFFSDDFRHLDNAPDPSKMCSLAQEAWSTFDPIILSGSQLMGGNLADPVAARAAFGGLIHVQQDFYAHSNWVDMNGNQIAPAIFPTCDPGAFPGLYTGYFDLTAPPPDIDNPLSGCPPAGPPPGFQQCHSTLNKDGPNTTNGAQQVPGTGMNKYQVAAQSSTTATTTLYQIIWSQVAGANGDNAAQLLFGAGGGTGTTPVPVDATTGGTGK